MMSAAFTTGISLPNIDPFFGLQRNDWCRHHLTMSAQEDIHRAISPQNLRVPSSRSNKPQGTFLRENIEIQHGNFVALGGIGGAIGSWVRFEE